MTKQEIINGLKENGYLAEEYTRVMNGVELEGVIVNPRNNVAPILYMKDVRDLSLEEIIDIIKKSYSDTTDYTDILKDSGSVLSRIYIGMQRESNEENLIKRASNFEKIEEYLYIRFSKQYEPVISCKANEMILEQSGISLRRAWIYGEENTKADSRILSMGGALNILGMLLPEDISNVNMCIMTNSNMYYGASAILNRELISKFASEQGVRRIIAIPSSIHEFILVPYDKNTMDGSFLEELNDLVGITNKSIVPPEEVLSDQIYILEV